MYNSFLLVQITKTEITLLLFVTSLYFFNWKIKWWKIFLKRVIQSFGKKTKCFLYVFFVEKNAQIFVKKSRTGEGKFNETERNGGAAEMKRKRRNVDTRAGKKEMHIPRMEFSGNTRRYTMGHQLQ